MMRRPIILTAAAVLALLFAGCRAAQPDLVEPAQPDVVEPVKPVENDRSIPEEPGATNHVLVDEDDYIIFSRERTDEPCWLDLDWCEGGELSAQLFLTSFGDTADTKPLNDKRPFAEYGYAGRASDYLYFTLAYAAPHSDAFTQRIGCVDPHDWSWSVIPLNDGEDENTFGYHIIDLTDEDALIIGEKTLYRLSFEQAAVTARYELPYASGGESIGVKMIERTDETITLSYYSYEQEAFLGNYRLTFSDGSIEQTGA